VAGFSAEPGRQLGCPRGLRPTDLTLLDHPRKVPNVAPNGATDTLRVAGPGADPYRSQCTAYGFAMSAKSERMLSHAGARMMEVVDLTASIVPSKLGELPRSRSEDRQR
jgi:hypothetical protein